MDPSNCAGCCDDFYNHNDMGLNMREGKPECWSLRSAQIVWRKEVPIDQVPPWTQEAKRLPNCYHKSRYIYVAPARTC